MNIFLVLILLVTVTTFVFYLSSWWVHAFDMMKNPKWISFSEFQNIFNEEEWIATTDFKNSLYGKIVFFNDVNKIHADIVRINGDEFRFNFFDYAFFKLFIRKYYGKLEKHDWYTAFSLRQQLGQ